MLMVAQAMIKVKGYFMIDGWFGFGAIFGFLCCLLMVLFAKEEQSSCLHFSDVRLRKQ